MATTEEIRYLGQEAAEQLIQNTKTTATSKVADHNTSADAHEDIRNELSGKQPAGDYVLKNEIPTVVEDALSQAKESGEFDGDPGYTPVRGTDYWTDEDKAEIKAYVDEAILGGAR